MREEPRVYEFVVEHVASIFYAHSDLRSITSGLTSVSRLVLPHGSEQPICAPPASALPILAAAPALSAAAYLVVQPRPPSLQHAAADYNNTPGHPPLCIPAVLAYSSHACEPPTIVVGTATTTTS